MATGPSDEAVVDFPTLWVAIDWTEAHCVIPDRDAKGQPFIHYSWQLWVSANWYRVKPTARKGQLATAFFYRRMQIVGPQKYGKGPGAAALVVAQARGPVVFDGWAEGGEIYLCAEHGCGCGWSYEYEPGEPMARPWATPLIQLTGTSDDAIDRNAYGYVKSMLRYGPLAPQVTVGEEFTRLPNDGMIETVTSSAMSRLGNPIIFALQDETGTYTDSNKLRRVAETQRRGAAGMGGRSIELTNTWDPSEDSVAQRTFQSKRPDVFKFFRNPDNERSLRHPDGTAFKFSVARERRKILKWVYWGAEHIDLDGIEAEMLELFEKDQAQAERFFGNRIVAGTMAWLDGALWEARKAVVSVALRTQVVLGFDGSDIDDWTGIRAETRDGYQFTPMTDLGPTIWNPADHDGQVPRLEVGDAVDWLFKNYDVVRMYADPPYWTTEVDDWAAKYGDTKVVRWYTLRSRAMTAAADRLLVDVAKSDSNFTHDGCEFTAEHVANARKKQKEGASVYTLTKPGDSGRKIDLAVCSILAHEAAGDATAAKLWRSKPAKPRQMIVIR